MSTDWTALTNRAGRTGHDLVGWLMWDPGAIARYEALGVPDGAGWIIGWRLAPLGDISPADDRSIPSGSIDERHAVQHERRNLVADHDPVCDPLAEHFTGPVVAPLAVTFTGDVDMDDVVRIASCKIVDVVLRQDVVRRCDHGVELRGGVVDGGKGHEARHGAQGARSVRLLQRQM